MENIISTLLSNDFVAGQSVMLTILAPSSLNILHEFLDILSRHNISAQDLKCSNSYIRFICQTLIRAQPSCAQLFKDLEEIAHSSWNAELKFDIINEKVLFDFDNRQQF